MLFPPDFAGGNQPGVFEDAEMLGDAKARHLRQMLGQLGQCASVPLKKQVEQGAAVAIRQCFEHVFCFHAIIIGDLLVTCQAVWMIT